MFENSLNITCSPYFQNQGIDCVTPMCEEPQTPTSMTPMCFEQFEPKDPVQTMRVTRTIPQFQCKCLKNSSKNSSVLALAEKKKVCTTTSISLSVVANNDMFAFNIVQEEVSRSARPVEKVSSVQLCKILDGALSKRKELLCKRNNSQGKKPKLSIRTQ